MSGLLSLLIREGAGLFGGQLIRNEIRRMAGVLALYAVVAVLGLAALAFLYVLIFDWLASSLGGESAAAILCGANLLLIALILIGRALSKRDRAPVAPSLGAFMTDSNFKAGPNFAAGLELGRNLETGFRKAAPQIALAAALVGLVIGARPELLELFRRRRK